MGKVVVLILAGGSGKRLPMNHDVPKQYMMIGDKVMIRHSVEVFLSHPLVDDVGVVVRPEDVDLCAEVLSGLKILPLIFGGPRRQDSVLNGLKSVMMLEPDKVLLHDAARPFITKRIITSVIKQLDFQDAVISAIPVDDTIKKCTDDKVIWTVDRADLWKSQTPQGFTFEKLFTMHEKYRDKTFTDDASICEYGGIQVGIVPGSIANFKISKDEDYQYAESIARSLIRSEHVAEDYVSGYGYDIHRIQLAKHKNSSIPLCGVNIESKFEIIAHSDGDVALHALTDAIFGAIGEKDIGFYFPPSDKKWENKESKFFVKFALERLSESKGRLVNINITIVAEEPKIAPHRGKMIESIAKITSMAASRISIKATTNEGVDAVGRREAILAHAMVTVALERF